MIALDEARARQAAAQHHHAPLTGSPADVLAATGWSRSIGGCEPYLALGLRGGHDVATIEAAVRDGDVQIVPSVRGCIYLVPAAHVPLALRIARRLSERRNARDLEKAGVDPGELDDLGAAVLDALAGGPLTTAGVRGALPDGAIRSTGPAGKKVGITSTLPPTLRQLEFAGQIVRTPVDGRVDHEKYSWRLAATPIDTEGDAAADNAELAALFVRWAGPATIDEFAAWTGLGKRDAKAAIAAAGLDAVEVEGIGDAWVHPDAPPVGTPASAYAWLPAMDNHFAFRSSGAVVADARLHDVEMALFGMGKARTFATANQPLDRTLSLDGRVVGVWAWSPEKQAIETHVLTDDTAGLDAGRAHATAVFEALGHAKAFSIDTDDRLEKRAARWR